MPTHLAGQANLDRNGADAEDLDVRQVLVEDGAESAEFRGGRLLAVVHPVLLDAERIEGRGVVALLDERVGQGGDELAEGVDGERARGLGAGSNTSTG